ncbi:hypothetical protein Scep_007767 [Stephania cephalantha]|uniref:Uncharacterized protein n=1 Tax=Stephania cephalantha TaxID=152367 RepID=A0AAP0KD51_9MAGN
MDESILDVDQVEVVSYKRGNGDAKGGDGYSGDKENLGKCEQEMDHLKMAITKIDSQDPNIILVEKSVSRYAQEYLLAKDISHWFLI